ncbi:hypothetical protein [Fulvimarina sp. MAC8]|uniref:hypothetical protein n=1 Tax=Fulvimarina sp. MAC8 TaxID=3162874 RepID=UPI0032EE8332
MSAIRAGETETPRPTAKLFSLADARADAKAEPQITVKSASAATRPRIAWEKPAATAGSGAKDGDRPWKWPYIVLCLNVACLTATVSIGAILAASYQPWQTLDAMNEKLGRMEGAEQRLSREIIHTSSRTDGLIQLRMDQSDAKQYELLSGLGSLRDSIDDTVGAIRESDVHVEDRLSEMMMSISDLQTASISTPGERRSGPKTVSAVLPASESETTSVPAPTRSPGQVQQAASKFERREMPDGSVAYRRID